MIDTVVFDVDGVLVDTDPSYIESVVRTVQWLLVKDAGIADDGPAISRADIRAFKLAGGWNNDWDLSTALYRWLLGGRLASPTTTTLRKRAGSAAEAALVSLDEHGRRAGARAPRTWEEVRGIFDEFYGGTKTAVARYGMPPLVNNPRALALDETVWLTANLVERLQQVGVSKFGVVTGRALAEWEVIAGRVPLPGGTVVSTEENGKKPSPEPLKRVVDMLDARAFVSVGDTMDDLRMAQAYARLPKARLGTPVMVCPRDEELVYRSAGASRFIRSIDELPGIIKALG